MKARFVGLAALLLASAAQGALAQDHGGGGPGPQPQGASGQPQRGGGHPPAPPQGGQHPAQGQGQGQGPGPGPGPGPRAGGPGPGPQAGGPHAGPGAQPAGLHAGPGPEPTRTGRRAYPGQPGSEPQRPPSQEVLRHDGRPGGGWVQNGAPSGRPGGPAPGDPRFQPVGPPSGGQAWSRGPDNRWRQEGGRPGGSAPGAAHQGPPPGAPRWEPRRYPPAYRSQQRFHAGPWAPPPGYYHRSWRFGEYLPHGWWGRDYLIYDWWSFELPEPPPGYEWVRVGYDALLIDDYDGRIVQVVQYTFW